MSRRPTPFTQAGISAVKAFVAAGVPVERIRMALKTGVVYVASPDDTVMMQTPVEGSESANPWDTDHAANEKRLT
jgi:hypothetical protein